MTPSCIFIPVDVFFYETSDGARNSENQRPDKFSFNSIVENKNKDGWYRAFLTVTNAPYGTLGYFFNKDTGQHSCVWPKSRITRTDVKFFASRYLDLAKLSPVSWTSPVTGKVSTKSLDTGFKDEKAIRARIEAAKLGVEREGDPVIGALNERPEGYICRYALGRTTRGYTGASITPEWSSSNLNFVKEAKRRGLTIFRCFQLLADQLRPEGKSKSEKGEPLTSSPEVRPFAMEWEGYRKLIAGQIELNQRKDGGTISLQLPDNDGTCTGNYKLGTKSKGTWALACTNGMAASGTFEAFGKNKGSSGEGTDTKGRKVQYTVGAG